MGRSLTPRPFAPRMLVVGGDDDQRTDLVHEFLLRGYEAASFRTGPGLLDFLERAPRDIARKTFVVLFAWKDPAGKDAVFFRELRERFAEFPVVVLSSTRHDVAVLEAARRGALAVLEASLGVPSVAEFVSGLVEHSDAHVDRESERE